MTISLNIPYRNPYFIGVGISCLVLIIYILWSSEDKYKGVWVGDGDFLQDSGLTDCILYIGEGSMFSGRPYYLYAMNEKGVIENTSGQMYIMGNLFSRWSSVRMEGVEMFPENCSMLYERDNIVLGDPSKEVIYAVFWRNAELSAGVE